MTPSLPNQRRERIRLACRLAGSSLYLVDTDRPTCIGVLILKPTSGETADAIEHAVAALCAHGFSSVVPVKDARLGLWSVVVDLGVTAL